MSRDVCPEHLKAFQDLGLKLTISKIDGNDAVCWNYACPKKAQFRIQIFHQDGSVIA